ncbi:transporter substrate-binding domain-containing protein [Oleidesulfovibrio sp.]|uniref:transporter substrate-binding domain-containing protein n=1 Tax=Oleidesulfovibrio sp. TaxID=2909707 RepID=UPI003A8B3A96
MYTGATALLLTFFCLLFPALEKASAHEEILLVRSDINRPPYEYVNHGIPSGFSVELTQAIARRSGLHLKFSPGVWSEIKEDVLNGKADVLAAMFFSKHRQAEVLFSEPYTNIHHSIFVRNGFHPATIADLDGKTVFVQQGDIMHDFALKHMPHSAIVPTPSPDQALELLAQGKGDAVLMGRLEGLFLIHQLKLSNVEVAGEPVLVTPLCFAFPLDRSDLCETFNEALAVLNITGEFDAIYDKWFGKLERRSALELALEYAAWVLTPIFIFMAVGLCWLLFLRKKLAWRTQQLQFKIEKLQLTEQALAESERKYRTIFETMQDGFYRADMNGKIQLCNPAAASILGYDSQDELIGIDIARDLYVNLEERAQFVRRILADGTVSNVQVELRRKNGDHIIVETNSKLIYNQSTGKPVAVEGGIRDVTTRQQLQELLAQTEKMISLGGLAAGMAHEINNPLGAILQAVQNIRRRMSPELPANKVAAEKSGIDLQSLEQYNKLRNIESIVNSIQRAGEQAAAIVSQILNFSQPEAPILIPSDINALIERVLLLAQSEWNLGNQASLNKISITTELSKGLPPVPCSSSDLEQVFLHLIRNAAQAMAQAKTENPRIVIRTILETMHLRVEVEDNGPGISSGTSRRIFDPFFTTKEVGEGTGLGLSVSYVIITQKHKGTVFHETVQPHGVRFIIRLPVFPEDEQS